MLWVRLAVGHTARPAICISKRFVRHVPGRLARQIAKVDRCGEHDIFHAVRHAALMPREHVLPTFPDCYRFLWAAEPDHAALFASAYLFRAIARAPNWLPFLWFCWVQIGLRDPDGLAVEGADDGDEGRQSSEKHCFPASIIPGAPIIQFFHEAQIAGQVRRRRQPSGFAQIGFCMGARDRRGALEDVRNRRLVPSRLLLDGDSLFFGAAGIIRRPGSMELFAALAICRAFVPAPIRPWRAIDFLGGGNEIAALDMHDEVDGASAAVFCPATVEDAFLLID